MLLSSGESRTVPSNKTVAKSSTASVDSSGMGEVVSPGTANDGVVTSAPLSRLSEALTFTEVSTTSPTASLPDVDKTASGSAEVTISVNGEMLAAV